MEKVNDDFMVNKGSSSEFERVPEGIFTGRCYMLMAIGTQTVVYKGETKLQKKVIIGFELLDEDSKMADGKPFTIQKTYTHTLNEKGNLYADLNSWRNKKFSSEELEGFSLTKILGAYAQVQILHTESENGKVYANINNILPYKGTKPAAVNDDILFSVGNPDIEVFNKLPDYLKRRVEASAEWDNAAAEKLGATPAAAVTSQSTISPNRTTDDVVITELDEKKPVDLDDIPF